MWAKTSTGLFATKPSSQRQSDDPEATATERVHRRARSASQTSTPHGTPEKPQRPNRPATVSSLEAEIHRLEGALQSAEDTILELQETHTEDLEAIQESHERDMHTLQEQYTELLERCEHIHSEVAGQLQAQVDSVNAKAVEQVKELMRTHEQQVEDLDTAHAEEIQQLKEQYESALRDRDSSLRQHVSEIDSLNETLRKLTDESREQTSSISKLMQRSASNQASTLRFAGHFTDLHQRLSDIESQMQNQVAFLMEQNSTMKEVWSIWIELLHIWPKEKELKDSENTVDKNVEKNLEKWLKLWFTKMVDMCSLRTRPQILTFFEKFISFVRVQARQHANGSGPMAIAITNGLTVPASELNKEANSTYSVLHKELAAVHQEMSAAVTKISQANTSFATDIDDGVQLSVKLMERIDAVSSLIDSRPRNCIGDCQSRIALLEERLADAEQTCQTLRAASSGQISSVSSHHFAPNPDNGTGIASEDTAIASKSESGPAVGNDHSTSSANNNTRNDSDNGGNNHHHSSSSSSNNNSDAVEAAAAVTRNLQQLMRLASFLQSSLSSEAAAQVQGQLSTLYAELTADTGNLAEFLKPRAPTPLSTSNPSREEQLAQENSELSAELAASRLDSAHCQQLRKEKLELLAAQRDFVTRLDEANNQIKLLQAQVSPQAEKASTSVDTPAFHRLLMPQGDVCRRLSDNFDNVVAEQEKEALMEELARVRDTQYTLRDQCNEKDEELATLKAAMVACEKERDAWRYKARLLQKEDERPAAGGAVSVTKDGRRQRVFHLGASNDTQLLKRAALSGRLK